MSKRTELNKGQSVQRKAVRRASRGNFWVPTTNTNNANTHGKVYKNVKAVKFTGMTPQAYALAKLRRKKK